MIPFFFYPIVKNKFIRAKPHQFLPGTRDEIRLLNAKGHDGNFGGDGNTVHLNCSGIYMIVYICQNSLSCTLKRVHFCICNYISIYPLSLT